MLGSGSLNKTHDLPTIRPLAESSGKYFVTRSGFHNVRCELGWSFGYIGSQVPVYGRWKSCEACDCDARLSAHMKFVMGGSNPL